MRTHYGPWQPCWISNQHQKHKSGRGPSSEHFWQVWLISVQRFQRRRFKCEKLTDGRTDGRRMLTHDKSSPGLWPCELKINKVGKQEVGIWWVQKRFPRYGVPLWSLWPNIRSLPSIVAEKNVTKNVHICSMCIKTNLVGKQEVGIWRVQKRFPQYGIPIWSLWPNIRFLSSIIA